MSAGGDGAHAAIGEAPIGEAAEREATGGEGAARRNPSPNGRPREGAMTEGSAHGCRVARRAASVVLVGLLFAFVYPTRTFLDQRSDTSKARAQLELLRSENAKLAREAKLLQSDAEIERRARQYGLVRPGERPFVIIPAPQHVHSVADGRTAETPDPPHR